LCIRAKKAGWQVVYDGAVTITHLKGVSVAKDYEVMSKAIFDANRDVYVKHFNPKSRKWVNGNIIYQFGLRVEMFDIHIPIGIENRLRHHLVILGNTHSFQVRNRDRPIIDHLPTGFLSANAQIQIVSVHKKLFIKDSDFLE